MHLSRWKYEDEWRPKKLNLCGDSDGEDSSDGGGTSSESSDSSAFDAGVAAGMSDFGPSSPGVGGEPFGGPSGLGNFDAGNPGVGGPASFGVGGEPFGGPSGLSGYGFTAGDFGPGIGGFTGQGWDGGGNYGTGNMGGPGGWATGDFGAPGYGYGGTYGGPGFGFAGDFGANPSTGTLGFSGNVGTAPGVMGGPEVGNQEGRGATPGTFGMEDNSIPDNANPTVGELMGLSNPGLSQSYGRGDRGSAGEYGRGTAQDTISNDFNALNDNPANPSLAAALANYGTPGMQATPGIGYVGNALGPSGYAAQSTAPGWGSTGTLSGAPGWASANNGYGLSETGGWTGGLNAGFDNPSVASIGANPGPGPDGNHGMVGGNLGGFFDSTGPTGTFTGGTPSMSPTAGVSYTNGLSTGNVGWGDPATLGAPAWSSGNFGQYGGFQGDPGVAATNAFGSNPMASMNPSTPGVGGEPAGGPSGLGAGFNGGLSGGLGPSAQSAIDSAFNSLSPDAPFENANPGTQSGFSPGIGVPGPGPEGNHGNVGGNLGGAFDSTGAPSAFTGAVNTGLSPAGQVSQDFQAMDGPLGPAPSQAEITAAVQDNPSAAIQGQLGTQAQVAAVAAAMQGQFGPAAQQAIAAQALSGQLGPTAQAVAALFSGLGGRR